MTLNVLMKEVAKHWVFDDKSYPAMTGLSEAARKAFALRHILMHQQKAAGKLAEVCEPADHGALLDEEKLHVATRNFFINTLRLAVAAGMNAEDLATVVGEWVKQKHVP